MKGSKVLRITTTQQYFFSLLTLALALSACSTLNRKNEVPTMTQEDPYLWLEEVESEKALNFAKVENEKTIRALKNHPLFAGIEKSTREILLSPSRLPNLNFYDGKYVYNFWQDDKSVRGLWRRTSLKEIKSKTPVWEPVLDLDLLAKSENENWVWKGAACLQPQRDRCLISLSRGGKDAVVLREFSLTTKDFIPDGFRIEEAKNFFSWVDQDHIFIGSNYGPESQSSAGYPLEIRLLKRGQKLAEAKTVFKAEKTDVWAYSFTDWDQNKIHRFHQRAVGFFEKKTFFESETGTLSELPFPMDSDFVGVFQGKALAIITKAWALEKQSIQPGTLIALPLSKITDGTWNAKDLERIFTATNGRFLQKHGVSIGQAHLYLSVVDQVQGKILELKPGKNDWSEREIEFGKFGSTGLQLVDQYSSLLVASYEDFLNPTSLYEGKQGSKEIRKLLSAPRWFDPSKMEVLQLWANSKDQTKVPYYLIQRKATPKNGKNPTYLYAYGGFGSSELPFYLNSIGKDWVEKGGIFVLANIRGGGEFGPEWHNSAKLENKQRSYDDFIAVSEDLIRLGYTSPAHLGIGGGSNGGLLVGAAVTQRPDLFGAVFCDVPLLDMLRYHLLLAGSSWIGEYGDPRDPRMNAIIKKYSPYQNVKANLRYPRIFISTSTKDDRVHPGHARKMVARLREYGHDLYYYENMEGGHAGAANIEQRIFKNALRLVYFWKELTPQEYKGADSEVRR